MKDQYELKEGLGNSIRSFGETRDERCCKNRVYETIK
jgi:hypothetical protein